MRRAAWPAAILAFVAAAAEARAQQGQGGLPIVGSGVGAHARRWIPQMDGDISAENGGLSASDVDVRGFLGLTEKENANDLGLYFTMPMLGHVNLQYWWVDYTGTETIPTDFNFAGQTFPAGSTVRTDLGWKVWSVLFETPMPGAAAYGMGGFSVEGGFKFIRIDETVESPSQSQSATVNGFFPVLGLRTLVPVSRIFAIEGEIQGIFVSGLAGGGFDGTFWEGSISAQITMSGFYAGVGYRYFKVSVEDRSGSVDLATADLTLRGLFFEVGLRF